MENNAAKRIVGDYAQDYPQDFTQSRSLEQRFEIKTGQALITGSIDLLLREDNNGNILDAKVIDFKSMDYPEHLRTPYFWINLSLQVQLYAHAADVVLDENAKTGSVHLLKEPNQNDHPNRIEVPIDNLALNSAITNISWAVNRILEGDFPMRPSRNKCSECDFKQICNQHLEDFNTNDTPPPIHIPEINGVTEIPVRCFSDVDE
jgi:DNA helicase-2/ATP-dependent DNA helicase PcrA